MNIFIHETKRSMKSVFSWIISVTAVMMLLVQIIPFFDSQMEEFRSVMAKMDDILLKGLQADIETLFTSMGLYSYFMTYIVLACSIMAMNLGLNIISQEFRLKTSDFLLTKPVSRTTIFLAKAGSVLASVVVFNIFFSVFSVAALKFAMPNFDFNITLLLNLSILFIQINFICIGMLISVVAGKIKSVTSVSLGIIFGFFMLSFIQSVSGEEFISYFVPLCYFKGDYILLNSSYNIGLLLMSLFVSAVCFGINYLLFIRRDVHAV